MLIPQEGPEVLDRDGIRFEIDTPVASEIVIGGKVWNVGKGSYIFGV